MYGLERSKVFRFWRGLCCERFPTLHPGSIENDMPADIAASKNIDLVSGFCDIRSLPSGLGYVFSQPGRSKFRLLDLGRSF